MSGDAPQLRRLTQDDVTLLQGSASPHELWALADRGLERNECAEPTTC